MDTSTKALILITVSILVTAGTTYSQNFWQATANPVPGGGIVNTIAFESGGAILAGGSDSSVYRSTDGGATWVRLAYLSNEPSMGNVLDIITYANGRIVALAGRPLHWLLFL